MKRFAAALILFSLSLTAFADGPVADEMKQIGSLFKAIQGQVNNPAANAQSAQDAAQLVTLFSEAQNQVPDSITSMPADQQAAAVETYKNLMQTEINDAQALEADFQNNNNADAATVLQNMVDTRNDGHTQFKN